MTKNKSRRMTKKVIESLPGPPKEAKTSNIEYSVSQQQNLCLAVYKNGSRSWRFKQKFRGKRLFITIGPYPLYDLADAIDRTRLFQRKIADNIDPRVVTTEEAVLTFREFVVNDFLPSAEKRYKTIRNMKHMFEKRILDEFGDQALCDITRKQIVVFHQNVVSETSGSSGNRYLSLVSATYKYAQELSLVQTNPCTGVRKAKENQSRTQYLQQDSFKRFIQVLSTKLDTPQAQALMLLCATGARTSEVLKLRFEDVSVSDKQVLIRDPKNGQSTYLALNTVAVELLQRIEGERGDKSPWVFPSSNSSTGHLKSVRRTFETVCKEAGIEKSSRDNPGGLRQHDLRRGFASQLLGSGVDLVTISRLLNHKSLKSTTTYARVATSSLNKSSEVASEKIKEALSQSL
jgi:site-specific recombinase XerD